MSAKNSFVKQLEAATSLASNFNSDPVDISAKVNIVGINFVTASITDNTGEFFVDHRIYKDANSFSEWVELSLSSSITLNNADISTLLTLTGLPLGQIRIRFEAAGSVPDGAVDIWISGRED